MTREERRLLHALAGMCEQYLQRHDADELDHQGTSAGEEAVELLVLYGMIRPCGRGGVWTNAGRVLLDERTDRDD